MIEKLFVVGSSFIPPIKHVWTPVEEYFEIHFGSIGNWAELLDKSNIDKSVVCIFLIEDLNPSDHVNQKEILGDILSVIRRRLSLSNKPFLFCFSLHNPVNIIARAKVPDALVETKTELRRLCDDFQNFYVLDMDALFEKIGLNSYYSYRNWYFANSRLTNLAWESLSSAIQKVLIRTKFAPKKILVLDCDNTIWGGIIGEDGLSGIILGQEGLGKAFKDFQMAIIEIHKTGTLLGIASKNNADDIWQAFDSHSEMIIKKSDIIVSKIGWNEKATSLIEMSIELNLSLNSFVFWDDNPFERDQMKILLPEVTVVEPPKQVELWPTFLKELDFFSNFYVTKEDLDKQNQYRRKAEFEKFQSTVKAGSDYLKNIQLSAKLVPIDEQNLSRAEQLSLKTNQFNLRSNRLKANEIRDFISHESNFGYLIHLKDLFGDHGLVALFLVRIQGEHAFVETFNISCRVFGRKLENWMIFKIEELSRNLGVKIIVFESVLTDKNRDIILKFLEGGLFINLNHLPAELVNSEILNMAKVKDRRLHALLFSQAESEVRGLYV